MITIVLAIYLAIIIITGLTTYLQSDSVEFNKHLMDIYESTDLNILSCTILWLIWFIINPLYHVFVFAYCVFHVGRRGD